jgi:hypothetical protein
MKYRWLKLSPHLGHGRLRDLCSHGLNPYAVTARKDRFELHGHTDKIGQRVCLHFLHHPTPMGLVSVLCHAKFSRGLFVQQAGHCVVEHFRLPGGESPPPGEQ